MTRGNRGTMCALATLVLAGCARAGPGPAPVSSADADGIVRTAGCATATSPSPMTIDGTPWPANQEALGVVVGRLRPYAEAHFAAVYTGVEVRSAQDRIRVYRKPSADFDAWVIRVFAADCVEMLDAPYSDKELAALRDRVAAELAGWQAKGVPVTVVMAKNDGTGIEVRTTDVERTKREFAQRYGTAIPIDVLYGKPPVIEPGVASN